MLQGTRHDNKPRTGSSRLSLVSCLTGPVRPSVASWSTSLTGNWRPSGGRELHLSREKYLTLYTYSSPSEFSTIDTTILVLGALFAGNYFGGEVERLALQLRNATQWSDAIVSETYSGVMAVVNKDTGAFGGDVK